MVGKLSKAEKKVRYDKKLCSLLDEYGKVLIAATDNVGSNQLQSIRRGLRGDSVILMGKNTLIRRCIRFHTEKTGNKDFLNLLPLPVGNVGLIFTKGDLKEVSEEVAKYKFSVEWSIFLVFSICKFVDNFFARLVKYSKDILSYLEDLWLNDECQYNGSMVDVFLVTDQ
ncbi:60S acidic ribosomal protein P0-like [Zingiber officinale]|uniref:60S acidic ribosomal protein P0-like n=1 Tax=Zingiber officinale TaxID=94328 RepID=UPI001C4DA8F5|nr:60S acidic ribosomal protein P0-like [Zingiber officinale]